MPLTQSSKNGKENIVPTIITKSKSKIVCEICLSDLGDICERIISCKCSKKFHINCFSMSVDLKNFFTRNNIDWLCPDCYFENLTSAICSMNKLKEAVSQIEEGFRAVKAEVCTYNQANNSSINTLREENHK